MAEGQGESSIALFQSGAIKFFSYFVFKTLIVGPS